MNPTLVAELASQGALRASLNLGNPVLARSHTTAEKPAGLVHVALDVRGAMTHRRLMLPGDRALVRDIAAKSALDLVRRALTA